MWMRSDDPNRDADLYEDELMHERGERLPPRGKGPKSQWQFVVKSINGKTVDAENGHPCGAFRN